MRLKNCAGHESTAKAEQDHSTKVHDFPLLLLLRGVECVGRADAFRTLGFTGSGIATSLLPPKLSPSIAWRKTTKSALRETLSSHMKRARESRGTRPEPHPPISHERELG